LTVELGVEPPYVPKDGSETFVKHDVSYYNPRRLSCTCEVYSSVRQSDIHCTGIDSLI
jgi:hypothetical protein